MTRSDRLVFTPVRAGATAALGFLLVSAAFVGFHVVIRRFDVQTLTVAAVVLGTAISLLLVVLLYGEESRLSRELRTARSGTAVARAQAVRRRNRTPWFSRFTAPPHGFAALLIAEGDPSGALDVLAKGSPLFLGGALATVRKVVEADARRTDGEAALGRSIRELLELPSVGSVEADRYRVHVLVKAILELGDPLTARDVEGDLGVSPDEDVRLYAAWLRTWFDLGTSTSPPLPDGERSRAALLARNAGALDLADRLSAEAASANVRPA